MVIGIKYFRGVTGEGAGGKQLLPQFFAEWKAPPSSFR